MQLVLSSVNRRFCHRVSGTDDTHCRHTFIHPIRDTHARSLQRRSLALVLPVCIIGIHLRKIETVDLTSLTHLEIFCTYKILQYDWI